MNGVDGSMLEPAGRLRSYWHSIGVALRPGASAGEMDAFESAHGVALPDEFRVYLSVVDGMDEEDSDDELFTWFALHRIRSIPAEFANCSGTPDYSGIVDMLDRPHEWYVFIDYLVSSHVYAVRFTPDRRPTTPVIWILPPVVGRLGAHRPMADTLEEFVEAYLGEPNAVLFPRGM